MIKKLLGRLKKAIPVEETLVKDYGRYIYKPVVQRALAEVLGIAAIQVPTYLDQNEVFLNKEKLDRAKLGNRLSSGYYEITQPSLNKTWRFFIA